MAPNLPLPQGTLDLLVLQALAPGPLHGFGVGQRIRQLAEEALQIEEGSLYPALYRMENRGWIRSQWGESENRRRARFYRLTATGRKQLANERDAWRALTQAVGKVLEAAT